MATLHIAIDESGCLNFSPKGSKFYVFSAAYTLEPHPLATALTQRRFGLMKAGDDISAFHCCEDKQSNRDLVFADMMAAPMWKHCAVVVEKCKVNPSIRDPKVFYPTFATPLLRFLLRGQVAKSATAVVICTDTLPLTGGAGLAIAKVLKSVCSAEISPRPWFIYHHTRHSNKWIQVADYCAWAIQRKYERADLRSYSTVASRLARPELDICAGGDQTVYY